LIRREPVPEHALHAHYEKEGSYADCYATTLDAPVSHERYIEAFYTTWLFKLERWILAWTVKKPSTDAAAHELARGRRTDFAAWTIEARATDQLLMRDFLGSTRSWFMVEPRDSGRATRLYFGSVVVRRPDPVTGELRMGRGFGLLLGFHKLYSRALLRAARARLRRPAS
jgi:hypothetical protein